MGYKYKFDNGQIYEFSTEPTVEDLAHVRSQLKNTQNKEPSIGGFVSELAGDAWADTKDNLSTIGQGIYTAGKGFLGGAAAGLTMAGVGAAKRDLKAGIEAGHHMHGFVSESLPSAPKEKELSDVMGAGFDKVSEIGRMAPVAVSALPFAGEQLAKEYDNPLQFGGELEANILMPIPGAKGAGRAVAAAKEAAAKGKVPVSETKGNTTKDAIDAELGQSPVRNETTYADNYADFVERLQWAKRAKQMEREAQNTAIPLEGPKYDMTVPKVDESLVVRGAEREQPLPQVMDPEILAAQKQPKGEIEPPRTPAPELKTAEQLQKDFTKADKDLTTQKEFYEQYKEAPQASREAIAQEKGEVLSKEITKENIGQKLEEQILPPTEYGKKPVAPVGFRGFGKSQRGAIHPDLLGVGKVASLLQELGPTKLLGKFKGTFNSGALTSAIRASLEPTSKNRLVWMKPSQFLELARERFPEGARPEVISGMRKMAGDKIKNIRTGLRSDSGLDSIPYLTTSSGRVTSHEGRHRAHTFEKMGVDLMPVMVKDAQHKIQNGPLPYHQLLSENNKVVDISNVKEVFPNAHLGQTKFGKSQRGSVAPLGDSPVLKGLNKFFKKKVEDKPESKFESNTNIVQATKDLPAAKEAFNGLTQVSRDPVQVLKDHADFTNDLTDNQLRVGLTVQSGSNIKSASTQNPFLKFAYKAYDAADAAANTLKRQWVDPVIHLRNKLSPEELNNLTYLAKKVEGKTTPITPEQMSRMGFSQNAIELWNNFRTASDARFQHLNNILRELGKKELPSRPNYFSSIFKGPYKAILKDPSNPNGVPIHVMSAPTSRKLDSLIAKWKEKYGKDQEFVKLEHVFGIEKQGEFEFILNEALSMADKTNPEVQRIQAMVEDFYKTQATYSRGGNQHLKNKATDAVGGAEGYRFEKNETQNSKDFWNAQIEYLQNGFHWAENQKMFENIGTVKNGIADRLPNTAKYLQEYRLNAMGIRRHTIGKISDMIEHEITNWGIPIRKISDYTRGALRAALLGGPGNLVFSSTQLLQAMNAIPEFKILIERSNMGGLEAVQAAQKAAFPMTKENIELLKWGRENGVVAATVLEENIKYGNSKSAQVAHTADMVWNSTEQIADAAGRGAVFLPAYYLFKQMGISKIDALESAADLTRRAMVDYRNPETPMMFSSGGLLGQNAAFLMKYPANWWTQFFSHLSNKDAASAGALMGIVWATSGLLGGAYIQLYEAMREGWNWAFAKQGYRAPSSMEFALKTGMSNTTLFGPLSTLTGIDYYNRMNMASTAPKHIGDAMLPGSSFITNAVGDISKAITSPTNQVEWQRTAHALNPSSTKGITEELFLTGPKGPDGKSLVKNPETGKGEYRRTDFDRAARFMGGRSLNETVARMEEHSIVTQKNEEIALRNKLVEQTRDRLATAKTPFERSKISQEYAKLYVQYGGTLDGFVDAVTNKKIESLVTKEEYRKLKERDQNLKRSMEYYNAR